MKQNLKIKKSDLQRLIETYLKRSGPQDIYFMEKHIKDTPNLAARVNSDLDLGLSMTNVMENDEVYGSNVKKLPQDYRLYELVKIVKSQLFKVRCALLLIVIIIQFISGFVWDHSEMKRTSVFIQVLIFLSLIFKIYTKWISFNIVSKENYGKKSVKVHILRDGDKVQILESQIKVGDVLFIDYDQVIPASGILISPVEITINEECIGKGTQRKLNLQHCINHIGDKNQLQLKVDYQNSVLPSPILIRGSRALEGAFRMLVLTTEQGDIIEKYSKNGNASQKSILQEWINTISVDLQYISQVCFITILVFHAIAMVFKVLGLPKNNYLYLMQNLIDEFYTIIAVSFLLDGEIIMDLLRREEINTSSLVQRVWELDKLLSIQQIIITDENICKYDQIQPKKIVLCDLYEPVDIKLLPAMQEPIHYNILFEILGGVELDSSLPHKVTNKYHKNAIIHVNNSQEKIFSSIYQNCNPTNPSLPHQQVDSVAELIKSSKLSPEHHHKGLSHKSNLSEMSNQCSLMQQTNNRLTAKNNKFLQSEKNVKLQDYLDKKCHFSTQNIVEGINKLAKNISRTYYFQKFTNERLSKSKYIWKNCKFIHMKTEESDRLLAGIKKLQKENLTVYLIGIEQGAFNNQNMSYLFGAIGVQINHQQIIIQKLKRLQKIGISSLITIFKNNFQEMTELQRHHYEYDFLKRGWMNENEHFCKLQEIKRAGGRKMCKACLLTRCECRPREEELSNIQGFLMAIQEVKCIYNVAQEDIEYIELGFEQLNITTLRVVDRKEDTIGRLNQIITGHQLISKLEEYISFWILNLLIIFFCCLPINYMTFGNIFPYEQLYFYFVYIQLIIGKNHFIKKSEEILQEQNENGRKTKKIFGWSIKGDILVFLLLLIGVCIAVIYFPGVFVKEDTSHYLSNYKCTLVKSFYHNPHVKTFSCKDGGKSFELYPKISTFIFLVTIFAITFKTFLSNRKILTLYNVVYHSVLISIVIMFTYLLPSLLHLSHDGITALEFLQVVLISAGIVFASKLNGWLVGWLQGGKRFHLTLDLSSGRKNNQYAQILREYKQEKSLKYPYEEQ